MDGLLRAEKEHRNGQIPVLIHGDIAHAGCFFIKLIWIPMSSSGREHGFVQQLLGVSLVGVVARNQSLFVTALLENQILFLIRQG